MTTFDTNPSFSSFFLYKLRRFAEHRKANSASFKVSLVMQAIVRVMLHLAGFSLLTIAAWQWNIIAGLAVAGISCFVFSTLMIGGDSD